MTYGDGSILTASCASGASRRFVGLLLVVTFSFVLAGCRDGASAVGTPPAAQSGFVLIPAGRYRVGSSEAERELAITHTSMNAETAGRSRLERELEYREVESGAFLAAIHPVLNREYLDFVITTGHRAPTVTKSEWIDGATKSGLGFEAESSFESHVLPLTWVEGRPPARLMDAPVVLVSRSDALAYCAWLSRKLGRVVSLPDEIESEILGGPSVYAWGDRWQSSRSHSGGGARGPANVGRPVEVAAPDSPPVSGVPVWDRSSTGVEEYTGQVYEWTRTPYGPRRGHSILKGAGSWADGPFESRRAARRAVPDDTRHILVGFRVIITE